jgi:O-antigen/teichoic acid export membrane protein
VAVSRTRTTQWNLLFHYISIALMLVSGVLLVPLYLQHISLKLYGAWLATGNILFWLTAVDPGLSTILQQRIATAYGKSDIQSVGGFISGGLLLSSIITLLLVLIGYALAGHIPGLLNLSEDIDHEILVQAFWIAVVGSSLQLFSHAVTSINQGLQSSLGIGLIYVVIHTLDIVLILYLLGSGYGLMALAYSALFRGVGMVIGNSGYLAWRVARERIGVSFSLDKVRELAGLIQFTFLAKAGSAVGNNIDAFVTARFLGADMVPVLVLSRKAFDICSIIISRPAMAITPALSHLVGEGNIVKARHVLIRLVRMMTWLLVLVAGGLLSLNSEFVSLWVGSHLYAGSDINMLLCLGLVLAIVTTSLSNLCVALGNIKGSSMATLVQSVIVIALLVVGAKFGGLIGVVVAPLIAMLLVGVWYFPWLFARLLDLTREDLRSIGGEFLKAVSAAAVPVGALTLMHTGSLADFVLQVIFFIVLYAVILGTLSPAFRAECYAIYREVYSRSAG